MLDFSLTKKVCRRKIFSCKFNSVAVFYCQISMTKVSELSNINNLCCVCTQIHCQSFCDK